MTNLNIQVKGLTEIEAKLKAVGKKLSSYMSAAAMEASKDLLAHEGLQKYPPETDANKPPTPYYVRGYGMQYKSKMVYKSEKLGASFTTKKISYGARIGNNASYAPYVIGNQQARHMKRIGWLNIFEFAKSQTGNIKKTFDSWVKKAIKDSRL